MNKMNGNLMREKELELMNLDINSIFQFVLYETFPTDKKKTFLLSSQ